MRNYNEIKAVGRNLGNRTRLKKRANLFPHRREFQHAGFAPLAVLLVALFSVDNFLVFFRHLIQRLVISIMSNWTLSSTITAGYLFLMGVFYGVMCRFISASVWVNSFCGSMQPIEALEGNSSLLPRASGASGAPAPWGGSRGAAPAGTPKFQWTRLRGAYGQKRVFGGVKW